MNQWDYLQGPIIDFFFVTIVLTWGKFLEALGSWIGTGSVFFSIHFHFWTMWVDRNKNDPSKRISPHCARPSAASPPGKMRSTWEIANSNRPVASGGAGGALVPPVFGQTLSQPGWQIMPTTVIQAPPPGFSDLATALNYILWMILDSNPCYLKNSKILRNT